MVIIGILAAIAVPAFLRQKEKAQETSTKADASRIAKDVLSYYVDGRGALSVSSTGSTWTLVDPGGTQVASGALTQGNSVDASSNAASADSYCVAVASATGVQPWHAGHDGLVAGTC